MFSGRLLTLLRRRGGGVPWYLAGGVELTDVAVAYQPIGAGSLALSYVNLVNPGTNNAAPGVAPTFNTATGWTFVPASLTYLTTGVAGALNMSILVRYSDATTGRLVGSDTSGAGNIYIAPTSGSGIIYSHFSFLTKSPDLAAGVVGFAGATAFRDGVSDGNISAGTVNTSNVDIGRFGLGFYFNGKIQALAIYNTILTTPQVLAISVAMAALPL